MQCVSYGDWQEVNEFLWFIQNTDFSQTQQFYYTITFKTTCSNCIDSSSGLVENRSNVSTFIVHSGIPKAYNRRYSQYNWDPRMHYESCYIGSVLLKAWWWINTVETCCLKCNYIIKLLCLTVFCISYEFEKHNGMTNFKLKWVYLRLVFYPNYISMKKYNIILHKECALLYGSWDFIALFLSIRHVLSDTWTETTAF
jgi:hypothetical protein